MPRTVDFVACNGLTITAGCVGALAVFIRTYNGNAEFEVVAFNLTRLIRIGAVAKPTCSAPPRGARLVDRVKSPAVIILAMAPVI